MTCRVDGSHKQVHTHALNLYLPPFPPTISHRLCCCLSLDFRPSNFLSFFFLFFLSFLNLFSFRPLPPTPSTHTRSLPVDGLQRGLRLGGDADDHCSRNHVVAAFEAR